MSRLDAFIRRMKAQRACINLSATLVSDLAGPVLELGLGQGRTYHHLLETFPDRLVYVVDDRMKPADGVLLRAPLAIKGNVAEVLPRLVRDKGSLFAVVHSDLGHGLWDDLTPDAPLMRCLSRWLPDLTTPGAVIISNLPLESDKLAVAKLPHGIRKGKIYLYRRMAD